MRTRQKCVAFCFLSFLAFVGCAHASQNEVPSPGSENDEGVAPRDKLPEFLINADEWDVELLEDPQKTQELVEFARYLAEDVKKEKFVRFSAEVKKLKSLAKEAITLVQKILADKSGTLFSAWGAPFLDRVAQLQRSVDALTVLSDKEEETES